MKNKKINNIKIGDTIYIKNTQIKGKTNKAFNPKYRGPYKVLKLNSFKNSIYASLVTDDPKIKPKPRWVNIDFIKVIPDRKLIKN